MTRAGLFDLDGTLVDSVADLHAAANALLATRDRPPVTLEQARLAIGHGARALIHRIWSETGTAPATLELDELYRDFLAIYRPISTVRTRPYPGVPQALETLRADGWALAVCTNKPEDPARAILEALGLAPHFAVVLGGDSLPTKKPDPAMLAEAVRRLGADRAVMVGDSAADVDAARAARIPVVAVDWGYAGGDLPADATVSRFADVPETMAALIGA